MEEKYSEVHLVTLPDMNVATYQAKGFCPEDDAIDYMQNWFEKNGIVKENNTRAFGFEVPVSTEDGTMGIRGYQLMVTVPQNVKACDDVSIMTLKNDQYAVMRIKDPFDDPLKTIPLGWQILKNWVRTTEFRPSEGHYSLEEIITQGDTTYIDLYYPVVNENDRQAGRRNYQQNSRQSNNQRRQSTPQNNQQSARQNTRQVNMQSNQQMNMRNNQQGNMRPQLNQQMNMGTNPQGGIQPNQPMDMVHNQQGSIQAQPNQFMQPQPNQQMSMGSNPQGGVQPNPYANMDNNPQRGMQPNQQTNARNNSQLGMQSNFQTNLRNFLFGKRRNDLQRGMPPNPKRSINYTPQNNMTYQPPQMDLKNHPMGSLPPISQRDMRNYPMGNMHGNQQGGMQYNYPGGMPYNRQPNNQSGGLFGQRSLWPFNRTNR